MKAHIVLAHPEPRSFKGNLAATTQATLGAAGWETTLSDLYTMGFDPREGAHHYPSRRNPEVFQRVGGVAFIGNEEGGLSTLDAHTNRWAVALDSLPARPMVPYNRDTEFDLTKRLLPDAPVHSPFIRHTPDALGS